MKYFRWLPELCLAVAVAALVGLPPAQALAETSGVAVDQSAAAATDSTATTVPDTLGISEAPHAPVVEEPTINDTTAVTNEISSEAQSGDATVANNGQAGDAISGEANASSTLLTIVNTATTLDDSTTSLFSLQVTGDTMGDIVLDDQLLGQPSLMPQAVISIEGTADTRVINNLTVAAQSGDATVTGNVSAGNAGTGAVQAAGTVVTIVNSSVSAQQSFLGIITINGNLIGDILVPARFTADALAPAGMLAMPDAVDSDLQIDNRITVAAQSGSATVRDNLTAGDASTGGAVTLVSSYSLINANLAATNMLWVFVQVLGEWNGTLLNQPPGSLSLLWADSDAASNTAITNGTAETDVIIENNISVAARSGDATVTGNVAAGSAATGDAKALVTVLNIVNSSLSSADWFGVLFINVFGSWQGNLGVLPEPAVTPTPQPEPPPVVAGATVDRPKTKPASAAARTSGSQLAIATSTAAPHVAAWPDSPRSPAPASRNSVTEWVALLLAVAVSLGVLVALLRRSEQKAR